MLVDEYPALVVKSKNLQYDIIFGANFLDKCKIQLDYDNNVVCWMKYNIPLCNTAGFFLIAKTPLSSHQLMLILKTFALVMPMLIHLQYASLMQHP